MNRENYLTVAVNKIKVVEQSEDTILFSRPLVITDSTQQLNGTQYDIGSMDVSSYKGLITVNHSSGIQDIVGKVVGLAKGRAKVTIDGIKFAVKENAMAQFAMEMLKGGFVTDFSIETIGPWPDEEGVYKDSKLVGLSMVIVGNNTSATVNQLAYNSIQKAKEQGLDTSLLEKEYTEKKEPLDKTKNVSDNAIDMKFVTVKNSRDFSIEVTYKNAAGDEVKTTLATNATIDVSEDQKEVVEKQINDAKAPEKKIEPKKEDNQVDLKAIVENAVSPLTAKIVELEQKVFDNSAKEPQFKKVAQEKITNTLSAMDWRERSAKQINYAWEWLKGGNDESKNSLFEINKFHLEELQKAKKVSNSITIADFGNFVINPELLSQIEGYRSNFQALLARFPFTETLSLQMAWLKRNGDINMQEVEMCDDGADGNLKPISEYDATIKQSNLHELAAVTPVCNAATRFLATDLLGDVSQGYRTDFDRKKSQLVIARLQQAVNETGFKSPYNVSTTVGATALNSIIDVVARIAEEVEDGVFIFNTKTYFEILRRAMLAGINTDTGFGLFTTGNQPQLVGRNYIVVPNELMPSLNSGETKTFVIEGENVTINQAIFYVNPSIWSGRTSGGLQYDLSTEAAYEVGGDVRSAYQRNELVLRGSFFRGGAIRDTARVASLFAAGVS